MAYYINPNAVLDNSIKTSSLSKKVQKRVDLYEINKQKPPIVGRCIPLKPEEGNRYYFADGTLKVKAQISINKLGFYYINWVSRCKIFTIPRKNTQDYIDLCNALERLYTGNFPPSYKRDGVSITSDIFELFPIFLSCMNEKIVYFTSPTRSPYVTINNDELIVDKPLIYSGGFSITSKPIYYRYENNRTKQQKLNSIAYDGLTWQEHRRTLKGENYKYKYTYRKKTIKRYSPSRRGYYKVCSIWRRYKISKNNVIYFKIMNHSHDNYRKICNKLNDRYKLESNIQP